jgi:hypothetical protein
VVRPGISIVNRLYYAYARHALVTALRMARVQPGDTVLIPHFICRDVLSSLRAVDAVPVFYHIDDDFQVASHEKLPPAKALLAVNYFGFPANLPRIQHQLTDATTLIIEDNAHGWLSTDEHGVVLGTRTSLGITSFRKTILSSDGAFLHWMSDQRLDYTALHDPLSPRNGSLPIVVRLRRGASRLERVTHLPVRLAVRELARLGRRAIGRVAIVENPSEEFELPLPRSVQKSSLKLMNDIDARAEISRRRTLFERSANLARRYGIQPVFDSLPKGVSPQGFPYYGGNGDERGFRRQVHLNRIGEPMSWPRLSQQSQIPTESVLHTVQLVNFIQ